MKKQKHSIPEDKHKTLNDWGKLTADKLRAKLESLKLDQSGRKMELQKRLYEHFNMTTPNEGNNPVLADILTEFRQLKDEFQALKQGKSKRNDQQTQRGQHTGDDSENIDPVEIIDQDLVQITQKHHNGVANTHNKNKNIGSQNTEALGNEFVEHPVFGFTAGSTNDQGMFYVNNSTNHNPYTPPAMKANTLSKINKQEYVDFDDILPPPPSFNNSSDLLGFQLDSNNNLLLKPNQVKAKIRDYPSWICAWNSFYQASLHYHPDTHYYLFSHFKIISNLARKHKFENVYLYDKSQRQILAAQRTISPELRSVKWDRINEELFQNFLRDSHMPACYHCSTYGHYASSCPYKPYRQGNKYQNPYSYVSDQTFRNDPQQQQQPQPSQRPASSQPSPQSIPTTPTDICTRFNRTGICSKPPCPFKHICNKCFSPNHTGFRCTAAPRANSTRTSFRPSSG